MASQEANVLTVVAPATENLRPDGLATSERSTSRLSNLLFYSWLKDIEAVLEDCHKCLRLEAQIQHESGFDVFTWDTQERLSELHWFVLTTQLAKLFSNGKQQRMSFYRLIEALRADKNRAWLIEELGVRPKARWKTTDELEAGLIEVHRMTGQHKEEITKLNRARNTATAHTDPIHMGRESKRGDGPMMNDLRLLTRQARRIHHFILRGFGISIRPEACWHLMWDGIIAEIKKSNV